MQILALILERELIKRELSSGSMWQGNLLPFREACLLEMEKDEKDDDNDPVVWVQIGEDHHSKASQKAQYTMPLRETMSGVAGTMISKQ
jgi:hypothetical protein